MILSIIKKVGGALVLVALVCTAPAWGGGDDFVIGTPPCNEGEPLFEVGRVKEK